MTLLPTSTHKNKSVIGAVREECVFAALPPKQPGLVPLTNHTQATCHVLLLDAELSVSVAMRLHFKAGTHAVVSSYSRGCSSTVTCLRGT